MIKYFKQNKGSCILFSMSLIFYLIFAFYDGAAVFPDSETYISMKMSREPFYSLFLALIRRIGGKGYLQIVVILQSILAAWAAFSLADFLRKEMKWSFVGGLFLMMIPWMTSLLCRFAAQRAAMYSNSIITEGITCSLFLLLIRSVLEYCRYRKDGSLIYAGILALIMILTRKQMLFTLGLLFVSILYVEVKQKKKWASLLKAVVCVSTIFLLNILLDNCYNYILRGNMVMHSGDNRFQTTMIFYTADREDFERLEEEGIRKTALAIYDTCDEKGYLKHSAEAGWAKRIQHFGDYYDCIQIDTMQPMIYEYVHSQRNLEGTIADKEVDSVLSEINRTLFPYTCIEIFKTFGDNVWYGLVNTVAKNRPILVVYAGFAYLLYMCAFLADIRKHGMNLPVIFATCTILSIVMNVVGVSLVIFCQTRYAIYNMPLFYMSGILLIMDLMKKDGISLEGGK